MRRPEPWFAAMVIMAGGAASAGANEFPDRATNGRLDKRVDTKALLELVNRLLG